MTGLDAAMQAYRGTLDDLRASDPESAAGRTLRALVARDAVAGALSGAPNAEELAELTALDEQLRTAAPIIADAVGREMLARWRAPTGSAPAAWWWSLDEIAAAGEPRPSVGWAILAGFFIALTLSFSAEIAQRFLAGQPDFFGVFSTILQGLLALLAGGALTQAGGRAVESLLTGRGIERRAHHFWKTGLALLVLISVLAFRLSLPVLAGFYNDRGVLQQGAGRITSAISSYLRAVSLHPDFALAHYNLGSAYEEVVQYDKALVEYQTAIQADPRLYLAYNNLARLYMLQKRDFVSALRLLGRGLEMEPGEASVRYSFFKNRAWAYLGLKLPGLAQADLRQALALQPEGAAAHCLLAQALEMAGQPAAALPAWEKCVAYAAPEEGVEPDWLATARERVSR